MTLRNRMLRAAAGAGAVPPVATDPQFNYVSLLLNDTGTNGQQNNTFLDSSTNNFTITRNGTPTQGSVTPYWPDGQWSNYFNGSNTFLSASANTAFVLDGSFTVEAWVFLTATPANDADGKARANICNYYQSGSTSSYQLHINKTDNLIFFGRNQSGVGITGSFNVPLNTWVHIAAVYNGTTGAIYVNGTSVTLTTNNWAWVAPSTPTFRVGALTQSSYTHYFPGYISNLRMVKGTAVYTSNFTPSTTPLTAVSGTSLLTCQSNRFKDNSSNNFAITVTGTPTVQAFEPFEPASSYAAATYGGSQLNNSTTNDYLSIASDPAVAMGSGAFTYETWFYPFSFGQTSSAGDTLFIVNASSGLQIGKRDGVGGNSWGLASAGVAWRLLTTTQPINYAWNHIVVVRSGTGTNQTSIFLNGVRVANGTATDTFAQGVATVGGGPQAGALEVNGYLANTRLVKGTAVYDPTLTTLAVPISPVTAITGTSLLLNFTNAGIYDAATLNDLVTVSNAQVSTTQAKFGSSSMYFNGSNDCLTALPGPLFAYGTGDFTVEGWFNFTGASLPSYGAMIFAQSVSGTNYFLCSLGDNQASPANKVSFIFGTSGGGTTITNGTATFSFNTWNHFAVVRKSGVVTVYLNGIGGTPTACTQNFNNTTYVPTVARYTHTSTNNFTGYLDDLRVTNGYARYTANFTPPTAPFPTR